MSVRFQAEIPFRQAVHVKVASDLTRLGAVDHPARGGYSPVSWPDVQHVRHLQQIELKSKSSSQGVSYQHHMPAGTPGLPSNADLPRQHGGNNAHRDEVDVTARHCTAVDEASRQTQRESMVADGTFLPVAPRDILVHSPSDEIPLHWHDQASRWAAVADTEPDSTVLHSLGKAWLHRSKLRGMVRQLKGAYNMSILSKLVT